MDEYIEIIGARVNNLKNVSLKIKKNSITCFMGPSGSGKTSLAFSTIYAESKRRFLNSLPSFIKFFSDRPAPVHVETIKPLLPVFALAQSNPILGARTQVSDLLGVTEKISRAFFFLGKICCPKDGRFLTQDGFQKKFQNLFNLDQNPDGERIYYAFLDQASYREIFPGGPMPARSFGEGSVREFNSDDDFFELFRFKEKNINLLNRKLNDSLGDEFDKYHEKILFLQSGSQILKKIENIDTYVCEVCGFKVTHPPILAHFNSSNAAGACESCKGYGATLEYDRSKIVKNRNLSVEENAITIYKLSKYKRYFPTLKRDLKNKGFDITVPFKNLDPSIWAILEEGGRGWPGLNSVYDYFERKKYKKNIRILMRTLQSEVTCNKCNGSRLSPIIGSYSIENNQGVVLKKVISGDIGSALNLFQNIYSDKPLSHFIGKQVEDIVSILKNAVDLGLGHLNLSRRAKTLSTGEYQRLLLVKFFSYQDSGSMFVLDEPGLGLGNIEQINIMKKIRDLAKNNTVLLIEHSPLIQSMCDEVFEFGPGSGHLGGEIIYKGRPRERLLSNTLPTKPPGPRNPGKQLIVKNIEILDKRIKEISLFLERINLVQGKSGSGKSLCFFHALANITSDILKGPPLTDIFPSKYGSVKGHEGIKGVEIFLPGQGKFTSRSTVGSQTGLGPQLRALIAKSPLAKSMGLVDGHFSFNSELGMCPDCQGSGKKIIDMQFLDDVVMECESCLGKRLNPKYGNLPFLDSTVNDIFSMPINEVLPKIRLTPKYRKIADLINNLGLSHLQLNRDLQSLSGGEKQRISFLNRLTSPLNNHLIILENISLGLGPGELKPILEILNSLILAGNSIVLIDQSEFWIEQGLELIPVPQLNL